MVNTFSTNLNPSHVSYDTLEDQSASSCELFLGQNGLNLGQLSKNQSKVISLMSPSYTYNENEGTTESHKACVLPVNTLSTFNVQTNGNNYSCILQNNDNVTLRLSSAKDSKNIIKGCAVRVDPSVQQYQDGDIYESEQGMKGLLNNAYSILDYEVLKIIESLRNQVKTLEKERDDLRDNAFPKSHGQYVEAYNTYIKVKTECDMLNESYKKAMDEFTTLISFMTIATQKLKIESKNLKQALPDYHMNNKLARLLRNINELSYITLYESPMTGFANPEKTLAEKIQSGGAHKALKRSLATLSFDNMNNKNAYSSSVHRFFIPSKSYRSIFFPPGLNAELYERDNFEGSKIMFSIPGYPNNAWSSYNADYSMENGVSGVIVQGSFNSVHVNDAESFIQRVQDIII